MSPVYYNDPAQWYSQENQRRDEQMRNLLNMVMAAKRFQYEQGQDAWSRGLQERQLEEQTRRNDAYSQYEAARVADLVRPEKPEPTVEELAAKARAIAQATAQGKIAGGDRPSAPQTQKPSDYDKKATQAERLYKAGKITEQEYNHILTGYTEDVTPRQNASVRSRIDYQVKKTRSELPGKYPKINKKTIAQIKQTENVNPDFPIEYDIAVNRILSDVGEPGDADTVKKYDDMFQFFQELKKRGIDKAAFMAMEPPPSIDRNTVAYWFDFYK